MNKKENLKVTTREIEAWLVNYISNLLKIPLKEVNTKVDFDRFGLDSASLVAMSMDLEDWLGYEVDPTLAYEYPTIESLARQIEQINKPENTI